jgi:hypothetical protein
LVSFSQFWPLTSALLDRIVTTAAAKSIRPQRSAHSSPRRAPLVIASQTNRPHTGSFHASEEIRAAWEADGGCGLGLAARGATALAHGLVPIHSHRTACAKALLRMT